MLSCSIRQGFHPRRKSMAANVIIWEHLIAYLEADAQKQRTFLQQRWPGKQFPVSAAEALMPLLDGYGQEGWELVSMQPVIVGENGDILINDRRDGWTGRWTSTYLCAFKRPKRSETE
jgi:hypothetical protein